MKASKRKKTTSPSVSDSQERQTRTTVTTDMRRRLRRVARSTSRGSLHQLADRMAECEGIYRKRCGLASCPRCSAHRSKRYRRRLEGKLRDLPNDVELLLITVTLCSDTVRGGVLHLGRSIAQLRRRAAWIPIVGGEQFIDVRASARRNMFNAHAHMICEVGDGLVVDVAALQSAWAEILESRGLFGSLHCQRVYSRWARW